MITIDTNVAFYALASDGAKPARAREALAAADFLSVQVLNEYASSARSKLARDWSNIADDLTLMRDAVGIVHPVDAEASSEAVRIAARYQMSFYDALIIAVALAHGADTLYTEDMQHGLVIDGRLRLLNPFVESGNSGD